jgi:hypothetical protein
MFEELPSLLISDEIIKSMNHQPSNGEITHVKLHLLSALNGVKINRYNYTDKGKRDTIAQTIAVPLKYGHKTRQIHEAIQINGQIQLPVISVTMSGMSLNVNRNEGKRETMYSEQYTGEDGLIKYYKPTPIDVNFNIKIVTTKGSDMEEIIAHYLSVFNPYIYISWKEPYTGKEIRSKVTWDGNFSTTYPQDTSSEDKIRYIADMGMTVESWIFREQPNRDGVIKKIVYNIGIDQDLNCHFDDDSSEMVVADTYTINGLPTIKGFKPPCVSGGKSVIVDGSIFEDLDGVFLTPCDGYSIPTSAWNPFCLSETLSAEFPEFQAYVLEDWQVIDDTQMIITIPDELSAANVEIGVVNRHCGIFKTGDVLEGCTPTSLSCLEII